MPGNGLFIVLEGADGSGKGTQFKILSERLTAVGYDVVTFDFPRYDQPSSHFVRQYLNGKYGPASQINPYAASMFYALDRYEAAPAIRAALESGKVVLSNRYAGSNMAHQGSKFSSEAQKRGFFMWADSLEFQLLGIPRPNLNIYLRVPADISYKLIAQKAKRAYTDKSRDEHESNFDHLQESVATYDLLCRLFPRDYIAIDSTTDGRLMPIPAINNLVWQSLQPYFHDRLSRIMPAAKTVSLSSTSLEPPIEAESKTRFTSVAPPRNASYKIEALSYRSVRDLTTYSEARITISSAQLNKPANTYFRPHRVQPGAWNDFTAQIEKLEVKRTHLLKSFKNAVPDDAASALWLAEITLPMGALLKAQLTTNEADLKALSAKMALSNSIELRLLAAQLDPSRAVSSISGKKTEQWQKYLSAKFDSYDSQPKLLNYWPKREFQLLESLAFKDADRGSSEIGMSLEEAEYGAKANLLKQELGNISIIEGLPRQPWYEIEVLLSAAAAAYLSSNRLAEIGDAQAIDLRYGYEVPRLLEKTSLDNDCVDLFDDSLKIYGSLQGSKQPDLADYAVLGGHRARYSLKITASQLHNLIAMPHPGLADEVIKLTKELKLQTADLHPIFWQTWSASDKPTPLNSARNGSHITSRRTAKRRRKS